MKETDIDPKLYLAAKDLAAGIYRFCGQMSRSERDVAGSEMYATAIELLNNVKLGKDHMEAFSRLECGIVIMKELTRLPESCFTKILKLMGELIKE